MLCVWFDVKHKNYNVKNSSRKSELLLKTWESQTWFVLQCLVIAAKQVDGRQIVINNYPWPKRLSQHHSSDWTDWNIFITTTTTRNNIMVKAYNALSYAECIQSESEQKAQNNLKKKNKSDWITSTCHMHSALSFILFASWKELLRNEYFAAAFVAHMRILTLSFIPYFFFLLLRFVLCFFFIVTA